MPQVRKPRPKQKWVHRLNVVLAATDPLVWRRIEIAEDSTFWDLHVAIQDSMGWLDYHLHEFRAVHLVRGRVDTIGLPDGDLMEGEKPALAGWKTPVAPYLTATPICPVMPILYTYDFGDDWTHVVTHEETWPAETRVKYPRCIGGARRCPPEDCGGPRGYDDFLAAIADRKHPEHKEKLTWVGGAFDPDDFDAREVAIDDPKVRLKKLLRGSDED